MSQRLKEIRGFSFIELAILVTVGGLCVVLALTVAIISLGEHSSGIQLPVLWRGKPTITLEPKLVWTGNSISVRGEAVEPTPGFLVNSRIPGPQSKPDWASGKPCQETHWKGSR
jgi:hypothetical protein